MGIVIEIDNLDDLCALMCDNRIPKGATLDDNVGYETTDNGQETEE